MESNNGLIRRVAPGPDDPPTLEGIDAAVRALSLLHYFPRNDEARSKIAELLVFLCSTQGQLEWLVDEMTSGEKFNDWPGPLKLREVFCERFTPADGRIPATMKYLLEEQETLSEPRYYREYKRIEEPIPDPMTPEEKAEFDRENERIMRQCRQQALRNRLGPADKYEPPDWLISCVGERAAERFQKRQK